MQQTKKAFPMKDYTRMEMELYLGMSTNLTNIAMEQY